MILNGSEEMIDAVTSTETGSVFAQTKDKVVGAFNNAVEIVKSKVVANADTGNQIVGHASDVKEKTSRFSSMLNAIKNFKIVEPTKNGFKYVFGLPVNGVKAAWNSTRSTKVKAAIVLAAIAGGSYVAYTYYQSTAQEADNN